MSVSRGTATQWVVVSTSPCPVERPAGSLAGRNHPHRFLTADRLDFSGQNLAAKLHRASPWRSRRRGSGG